MRSYKFALTANAGLAIHFPGAMVWVDALHIKKAPLYSTVTPEIWQHMLKDPDYVKEDFSGPDAMVVSHCHIDHFTSEIVREAMQLWPGAAVLLPEKYFPNQVYIDGFSEYHDIGDIRLHFFRTRHSTRHFHNKKHYSLLFDDGAARIFMPVDASLTDPVMHFHAVSCEIDIAVVDFTWLLLGRGRDIILNDIRPKHLLIYHLPFRGDDSADNRSRVRAAAALLEDIPDIRILDEPFRKETITI